MTSRPRVFALAVFACLALGGAPQSLAATSVAIELAQVQTSQPSLTPTPAPQAASAPSPETQTADDEPIGNVAKITGVATVIRNKNSIALKVRDDIYLNDVVQTAADSTLSITFSDATTFNLSANARITIDNYVYEDGGNQNAGLFDVGKGTVAFVAAAVAKTGDMKITTPTATLSIRGTTGVVEVPEGAAASNARNVNIKLYPDADGRVGRIEVNDRTGARLGFLNQASSGFAIRPGTGGVRLAAVPLAITLQEARRDQGFVRQVHAAQSVGRQIVTEQRAFRRANPGLNNRGNQLRQPGPPLQRQNGLPGQNRPGLQQPTTPNRQGTPPQRQGGLPQQGTKPLHQGRLPQTGFGPRHQGNLPSQGPKPSRGNLPQPNVLPQRPGNLPPVGAQRTGAGQLVPPRTGQNPQGPGAAPQPALQPQQGGLQRPPALQPRLLGLQRPGPAKPAPGRPVPPKDKKEIR